MKMHIAAVLFVLSFVAAVADRTTEEWKAGIEQLFANITEAYTAKNFAALEEYNAEDYQGFHPGALDAVGVKGIDESRHYIKMEQVKLRFTASSFAVTEFMVHQESLAGVKQLEHGLAVVVEENCKLKIALALWNFVNE